MTKLPLHYDECLNKGPKTMTSANQGLKPLEPGEKSISPFKLLVGYFVALVENN